MTHPIDAAAITFLRGLLEALERGAVLVTSLRAVDPAEDEDGGPGLSLRWRGAAPQPSPVNDVDTSPGRAPRPLCASCRSPRLVLIGDGAICQDCAHEQR